MAESNTGDKHNHPYQVCIKPWPGRVRAYLDERLIADSEHALLLEETRHTPVYYFPEADVRMDWLQSSEHSSHCPFKGQASYWNFNTDGMREQNLAWAYQEPIPEVAAISGHLSFYPDRVSIRSND